MDNGRKRRREDEDELETNRKRPLPSFYSVIRGALMAEAIKGICSSLEPMIRRVIREEVQLRLWGPHPLYGNRQYFLEQPLQVVRQTQHLNGKELPTHKLVFAKQVPKSIYTGNSITDTDSSQLQIQLIDINTGEICTNMEGSPIKVKLVAIDGDLDPEGFDGENFSDKIVKPRDGKPPLLVGNTEITLKQGVGYVDNISFTDNSKWLRCGKVRLGAFVDTEHCASATAIKIGEALTEKFAVKDQRGELYKKHYPPMPNDEVWRLEIIAKDGVYHQRLKKQNIKSVEDFLMMWRTDADKLKEVLQMATNKWNKVVKHAQTCPMAMGPPPPPYSANLENNGNASFSLPCHYEETPIGAGAPAPAPAPANHISTINGPEFPFSPNYDIDFNSDFWSPQFLN